MNPRKIRHAKFDRLIKGYTGFEIGSINHIPLDTLFNLMDSMSGIIATFDKSKKLYVCSRDINISKNQKSGKSLTTVNIVLNVPKILSNGKFTIISKSKDPKLAIYFAIAQALEIIDLIETKNKCFARWSSLEKVGYNDQNGCGLYRAISKNDKHITRGDVYFGGLMHTFSENVHDNDIIFIENELLDVEAYQIENFVQII